MRRQFNYFFRFQTDHSYAKVSKFKDGYALDDRV